MPATRWHWTSATPVMFAGTAMATVVRPPRFVTKPWTPASVVCCLTSALTATSTSPPPCTSLALAEVIADLIGPMPSIAWSRTCLLYTSDAADDLTRVDLGGRCILQKKKNNHD